MYRVYSNFVASFMVNNSNIVIIFLQIPTVTLEVANNHQVDNIVRKQYVM